MPFINIAMRDDAEARAVTVGAMVRLLSRLVCPSSNIALVNRWMGCLLFLPYYGLPRSRRFVDRPMLEDVTLINSTAPRWTKGYSVNIAFVFFCWFFFMVAQYLYRRDEKKRERDAVVHATKDEEDAGLEIHDKGGEVVEHIEQRNVELAAHR